MSAYLTTGVPQLHPIAVVSPWYCIGIDFIGPLCPTAEDVECSNCQEWFHVSCEVIPKEAIEESKVEWLCSNCTNT